MKRGRPTTGAGSSRNSDYYLKRLRKTDGTGMKTIKSFFQSEKTDVEISPRDVAEPIDTERLNNQTETDINEKNCILEENEKVILSNPSIDENKDDCLLSDNIVEQLPDPILHHKDASFNPSSDKSDENSLLSDDIVVEMFPEDSNLNNKESSTSKSVKTINSDIVLSNVSKYEKNKYWVYYSPSAEGFLCKVCSIINKKGPWVTDGVNFHGHPTRCMKMHEDSKLHRDALNAIQSTNVASIIQKVNKGASNEMERKQKQNNTVMNKFVKVIYFMVQKQWAVLENFESLIKFLGSDLGDIDIKMHLDSCAKNATYLSHFSVQTILGCISDFIEESALAELKVCDAFTLFADESTDKAQREQLALVAKFKRPNMSIKEQFLGLINLTATDAASIMRTIEQFMLAKGLDLGKCLFVCLDGTNTMSGQVSGLQRRIKHKSPHCIYINCRNHRLALVFTHLLKKYSNLKSVDILLISLWKMFHYSPQKYYILKNIQENVYNLESIKMLKVSTTRWLSHGHACARVASRYKEIVETLDTIFEKSKEPEVKGVREQLLNPEILLTILFLADILKIVDKLNLWLQKEAINFSSLRGKIQIILKEVEDLISNLEVAPFFSKSSEFLTLAEELTTFSRKLRKNKKTNVNETLFKFRDNFINPFFKDFKSEIEAAFEVKEDSPLASFDVFLQDFGEKDSFQENLVELKWTTLISYYGNKQMNQFQGQTIESATHIDQISAKMEIKKFESEIEEARLSFDIEKMEKAKSFIRKNEKEKAKLHMEKKITPSELINILEKKETVWSEFPNLMKLLTLCVIIPSSSATVERLFSRMNLVCSKLRCSLSQKSLNYHLNIILNGETKLSDEQSQQIISIFKNTENRRISL